MHKFFHILLGILCFNSSTAFSWAEDGSCLYHSLNQGFDQYKNSYKGSVFKVYKSSVEKENFLGTATLIDNRGYFLTASHIFREDPYKDEYFNQKIEPYPLKLYLQNAYSTFEGTEFVSPLSKDDPDLSIIHADLRDIRVPPVEPFIESPGDDPGELLLMGFSEDVEGLEKELISSTAGVTSKYRMIIVAALQKFKGKSGSLGINSNGYGIAALHGNDESSEEVTPILLLDKEQLPKNRGSVFLTPTYFGKTLFLQIPNSARGKALIDKIKNKKLTEDKDFIANLKYQLLSNIELIHLYKALEEDYVVFNNAYNNQDVSKIIEDLFSCKGLKNHVINFLKLDKKHFRYAGYYSLKNGRDLARVEAMLEKKGWPISYRAEISRASYNYLNKYKSDPSGLQLALKSGLISNPEIFESNLYVDLAKIARKTKDYYSTSNITDDEIEGYIEVALEKNEKNFKAHRFLAAEYSRKNKPGEAAWATATAIKLGDPTSEKLLHDLKYSTSQAMVEPDEHSMVPKGILPDLVKLANSSKESSDSRKLVYSELPPLTSKDVRGRNNLSIK